MLPVVLIATQILTLNDSTFQLQNVLSFAIIILLVLYHVSVARKSENSGKEKKKAA